MTIIELLIVWAAGVLSGIGIAVAIASIVMIDMEVNDDEH